MDLIFFNWKMFFRNDFHIYYLQSPPAQGSLDETTSENPV